jgi:hypothetical protein
MVEQKESHEHLQEIPEIGEEAQSRDRLRYGRGTHAKEVEDDVQERDHTQRRDRTDAKRE